MKIATYLMKIIGSSMIVLFGLISFIYCLSEISYASFYAFWSFIFMSGGVVLLAFVLEKSECPFTVNTQPKKLTPASRPASYNRNADEEVFVAEEVDQ